jgi:hypothetical protein
MTGELLWTHTLVVAIILKFEVYFEVISSSRQLRLITVLFIFHKSLLLSDKTAECLLRMEMVPDLTKQLPIVCEKKWRVV